MQGKQANGINNLVKLAKEIRKSIIRMCYHAGEGHIAPSFSCVELLVALYFKILKLDINNLNDENRDRFILSKGHAALVLYATLAEKGIINKNILNTFCQKDSILGAHPEAHLVPGVEFSSGSLGHGLSFGAGLALAGKMDKKIYRTFVLLSDGECQEGSLWEAIIFASAHKLDNLIAVVDYNKLQSLGRIENILPLEPFKDKWQAFGWSVKEVDGHNIHQVMGALESIPFTKGKPNVLIAHTTKGKGVSFMESCPIWHSRVPSTKEEWEITCQELEIDKKEFKKVFK